MGQVRTSVTIIFPEDTREKQVTMELCKVIMSRNNGHYLSAQSGNELSFDTDYYFYNTVEAIKKVCMVLKEYKFEIPNLVVEGDEDYDLGSFKALRFTCEGDDFYIQDADYSVDMDDYYDEDGEFDDENWDIECEEKREKTHEKIEKKKKVLLADWEKKHVKKEITQPTMDDVGEYREQIEEIIKKYS